MQHQGFKQLSSRFSFFSKKQQQQQSYKLPFTMCILLIDIRLYRQLCIPQ